MLTGSILKVRISSSCCGMSVWFYVAWASKVQEVEGSTTISPQFHNNALWRPSYGQTFLQLQHTMHQSTWQWQNIFGYLVTEKKNNTKEFSLFVIFGDPKSTKNSEKLPHLFLASSTVTGPTCDESNIHSRLRMKRSTPYRRGHWVTTSLCKYHITPPRVPRNSTTLGEFVRENMENCQNLVVASSHSKKSELGWNKYLEIVILTLDTCKTN